MRLCFTIVVVLVMSAPAAWAQDWARFEVGAGALIADFQTDVKLDASATVFGTPIDVERDLGLEENATTAWAGALWRISRRHHLEILWTRANRDVLRRQLQRDITFGDETFTVAAQVDAFLDTWIVDGNYRFAVVTTPVVEFGPLIGALLINLSTGIALSGSVSGSDVGEDFERERSFTAPAVLPGAFIAIQAHPRLTIHARGGYISADFGNIDGEIVMAQAGADVKFTPWLGVGGVYSYNRLAIGVEDDTYRGDVRYAFSGPQVYALFSF